MSIAYKVRPIGGEALLPDGYRRCEYLESTGTQYIDTGIKLSNESEVKCEFMQIKASSQFVYAAGSVFALHVNNNIRFDYCGLIYNNMVETASYRFRTTQNSTGGWINGEKKASFPVVEAFETTQTTQIFAYNSAYKFIGRIYSFSISRNNQLQLNFIPCLDDTGTPCMFDTVSRTPYYNYNKGTGEFLYKLKTPITRKLPRGYQPLEYLESTGPQYIRTGIIAAANIGTYAIFTQEDYTDFNHVLSATNFYTPHVNNIVGVLAGRYGNNGREKPVRFTFPGIGIKITANTNWLNSKKICVDDECIDVSEAWTGDISGELTLFNFSSPSATLGLHGRIYSAKISGGTEIIRDFVPCLDAKGKPCMWDYVTRRPFYNQDTTGPDFLYG